jgi:Capsule polysaccharide biosynthesis protein
MSLDPKTEVPVVARAWRSLRRRVRRPDYWAPPGYMVEFPATAEAFKHFLERVPRYPSTSGGEPVGVVIAPWLATPLPWWAITLALGLQRRGRPVVLLWDDTELNQDRPGSREQNEVIRPILERVEPMLPVVRVSRQRRRARRSEDRAVVSNLAQLNETWRLRGGPPTEADARWRDALERDLARTLGRLRSLFARQDMRYVVAPGGIWGTSGLFMHAGEESGVRVSSYDAGQGWFLTSNYGPAAQQTEVGQVFQALWRDDLVGLERCLAAARAEFEARAGGRDRTRFQVVGTKPDAPKHPGDVLIPMNVDFDTAALGRHVHFADTTEWVAETVAFTLAHSSGRVVVRQHPSERRELERSRLDLRQRLVDRFGNDQRVRFVAADDPVSSYDLLRNADLVVPFVSTFGIEAAALGKTVIAAGASYYANLGFVYSAPSRTEYFKLLDRALSAQLPPLPQQREKAWLCYYLSQCCNRVWSDFTPQPNDFWKWCVRPPTEIFEDPAVEDLLTSIDEHVPLALVRHHRANG